MEAFRANAFAGHTRMGVCISRQGAGLGILPEYRCIYDYGTRAACSIRISSGFGVSYPHPHWQANSSDVKFFDSCAIILSIRQQTVS